MKSIPSEAMLRERCEQLLNTCRELFEDMTPDLNVSFSVGAVMIPDHGTQYNDLLTFLAEVMAVFLVKKSNQERALRQAENLRSVLDRQDAWIYVIDPETCELKFLKAKAKSITPRTRVGMRCYEAFMGRDSRCENCPAAHIKKEQNVSALIRNDNLDVNVRTMASLISWNGEDACLLTCYDLDKEKEIR